MKFSTTFKIYRSPPQTQTNQATSLRKCEQQSPMCMFVCFDLPTTTTQCYLYFSLFICDIFVVFLKQKICVESSKMSITLSKSY